MSTFQFHPGNIPGLQLISPNYMEDSRGFFLKTFERNIFRQNGIDTQGFEAFYTNSAKGTVRGLHFQRRYCQDKLVHVLCGAVYDVVVDLRKNSETFGQWEGFYLNAENRKLLYIPKGLAHGFLALEDHTLFSYLCGSQYDPQSDGGIFWNDPSLAIHWPVEQVEHLILSEKDAALPDMQKFLTQYGPLTTGDIL